LFAYVVFIIQSHIYDSHLLLLLLLLLNNYYYCCCCYHNAGTISYTPIQLAMLF